MTNNIERLAQQMARSKGRTQPGGGLVAVAVLCLAVAAVIGLGIALGALR